MEYRIMLIQHLAEAKARETEAETRVILQRRIVTDLERGGVDTSHARELLAQFEKLLAAHTAERRRIEQELSQHPAA
jgi:hypothetical protein